MIIKRDPYNTNDSLWTLLAPSGDVQESNYGRETPIFIILKFPGP